MKRGNRPGDGLSQTGGASLVEVMVAVVILGLMATGAAAFLYQSRSQIAFQEDRRVALDVANGRLEELRASPYVEIQPPGLDYDEYYLFKQSDTWFHTSVDPRRTVNVNGRLLPMATTVQYMDADGGPKSFDLLKIRVEVGYRPGSDDRVVLESFYSQ